MTARVVGRFAVVVGIVLGLGVSTAAAATSDDDAPQVVVRHEYYGTGLGCEEFPDDMFDCGEPEQPVAPQQPGLGCEEFPDDPRCEPEEPVAPQPPTTPQPPVAPQPPAGYVTCIVNGQVITAPPGTIICILPGGPSTGGPGLPPGNPTNPTPPTNGGGMPPIEFKPTVQPTMGIPLPNGICWKRIRGIPIPYPCYKK